MKKVILLLGLSLCSSLALAQNQTAPQQLQSQGQIRSAQPQGQVQAEPNQLQPLGGPYNPNHATALPRTGNASESVNSQIGAGYGGTVTPNFGTTQTVRPNGTTTNPSSDLPIYRENGGSPLSTPVPLQSGSPVAPTAPGPMGF